MTCIAWDGETLAADRLCVNGGIRSEATKLFVQVCRVHLPLEIMEAIAFSGDVSACLALKAWYLAGEDPAAYPACQKTENYANLIVARRSGVYYYARNEPVKHMVLERLAVWGSGGDLALGAMAAGATAKQAVEIAIDHSIYCGCGIDLHTFE